MSTSTEADARAVSADEKLTAALDRIAPLPPVVFPSCHDRAVGGAVSEVVSMASHTESSIEAWADVYPPSAPHRATGRHTRSHSTRKRTVTVEQPHRTDAITQRPAH